MCIPKGNTNGLQFSDAVQMTESGCSGGKDCMEADDQPETACDYQRANSRHRIVSGRNSSGEVRPRTLSPLARPMSERRQIADCSP